MSSPKGPHNYINPVSIGKDILIADVVGIVLVAVCIILRLSTKFFITHQPGWDDGETFTA